MEFFGVILWEYCCVDDIGVFFVAGGKGISVLVGDFYMGGYVEQAFHVGGAFFHEDFVLYFPVHGFFSAGRRSEGIHRGI